MNDVLTQSKERRISAALRLTLAILLLLGQIAIVVILNYFLRQYLIVGYAVLELLAVIVSLRIFVRPGSISYKFGWILLILALPVAGIIFYLLWSGDFRRGRGDLKDMPQPELTREEQDRSRIIVEKMGAKQPEAGRIAAYLGRKGFALYDNTRVKYFADSREYLEDVFQAMEKAHRFILMEHYIMAEGELWERFLYICRCKSNEGVEIKVLFDDFGSIMRVSPAAIEALHQCGAEVLAFNPVHQYVNRLYFNYRDHRKIVAVDDYVYTGGVNFADEYAGAEERFDRWKDCGVRLQGGGTWGLTREFIHMWQRCGGQMKYPEEVYRTRMKTMAQGYCQPFTDGPDRRPQSVTQDVVLQMIHGAKRSLDITTPYLAIDEAMMKALCMAADSGVEVRLLMPGIPDHRFAFLVAESYWGELLSHGVKIYTYTGGFLHGKSLLADGTIGYVGSANMDYRSFQLHFECGVMLYHVAELAALQQDQIQTVAQSQEVTLEQWRHRPWHHKLFGAVLRLFAAWM